MPDTADTLPLDYNKSAAAPTSVRYAGIAVVAIAHIVLLWAVMQISSVRQAVTEAVPVFARWIIPAPPAPKPIEIPPIEIKPPPKPKPKFKIPPPVVKTPTPVTIEQPIVEVANVEPVEVDNTSTEVHETPPPVAASPQPKTVSISAVRYRVAPRPVYPKMSRRLREEGEVLIRVLIDTDGQARQQVLIQSSGKERLDEAAMMAIRQASFYPYEENKIAIPVWVIVPVMFGLEQ
ncbi:MAG: energy transducer TonB [Burkholderiales bacterium]|jgi:protein TonB|nr:energy transducer TonB [Burkholderiales bacterium]